jgi:hypothetical protein
MALDEAKRKVVLTTDELAALDGLDRGARYNVAHSTARGLVAKGLALDNWGWLGLTETGRRVLRQHNYTLNTDHRILRTHVLDDDQIADLSTQAAKLTDDPFAAPHRSGLERSAIVLVEEEEPYAPLPPADDDVQRAMRAAGVASGVTGVWPEIEWVHAFIEAFVASSKLET